MRGMGKKKFIKDGLIGYIQKIIITALIIMFAVFILNLFIKMEYWRVLEYSALGSLALGALSVLGAGKTTYDGNYAWHKSQTGMTSTTKNDIELLQGSYGFCLFMGITGGVLYLVSLLFYYSFV